MQLRSCVSLDFSFVEPEENEVPPLWHSHSHYLHWVVFMSVSLYFLKQKVKHGNSRHIWMDVFTPMFQCKHVSRCSSSFPLAGRYSVLPFLQKLAHEIPNDFQNITKCTEWPNHRAKLFPFHPCMVWLVLWHQVWILVLLHFLQEPYWNLSSVLRKITESGKTAAIRIHLN